MGKRPTPANHCQPTHLSYEHPMTQRTDWEGHWQQQNIPWDQGEAAPELLVALGTAEESSSLDLSQGLLGLGHSKSRRRRALVPGCGQGWDAFALAGAGFEVVGLDLAPSVVEVFSAGRERLGVDATIEIANFFEWEPDEPFDVIWDYTFLCAIHPSERPQWREKVKALLAPEGVLATLIFPAMEMAPDYEGPPWPLHPIDVQTLLQADFDQRYLAPARRSPPPRAGKEHLGLWTAK